MLKKIRCKYIFKLITIILPEKRLLQLAKYNQKLQKKLGKRLINYKTFSGKYIKYEISTKGKIYNAFNNKLIFEGEFYNHKKCGKGKEYYDNAEGKLKFEGEYLNDKRNGKGKEYNYNGELKYEGEYLNDKRKGKGKEYFIDGKIKAEYEYIKMEKFGI